MEHESFEDVETARYMNEHFVSVKVDREERPDLDGIYMEAVQTMTGQGGWPMTVFLTPGGEPFYAGTYFPKVDRHGIPSFRRVLEAVAEAWGSRRHELEEQGRRVAANLGRTSALRESSDPLREEILQRATAQLRQSFDAEWGGFGAAPKFPQPATLEFLLRCHLRGYAGALDMVAGTLERMARGGIHDQLGGGFHRYATDRRWLVPHFEKMLYDNAQLARLYTRSWQVIGWPLGEWVARRTIEYVLRELRHPDGGFFSSQDADSEGREGTFFVWSHEEFVDCVRSALDGQDDPDGLARGVAAYLGVEERGNWEGTNVLWKPVTIETAAGVAGVSAERMSEANEVARLALLDRRERRARPGTDDKILAGWNGLAISALAEAGRVFGEPRYVEAAVAAAEFVLMTLRDADGRLLRSWRDGRATGPGYLEDHAMLAEACLTLYETTFDERFFVEARRLADDMLELFRDPDHGGFYQTGSHAERLVVRPKDLFDNAVPSGNSVAAEVLQRLGYLTGEPRYERAAVSALRVVRDLMERAPSGFGHALSATDLYLSKVREVAIVGDPGDEDTRQLVSVVRGRYRPNLVLAVGADRAVIELLRDRPTHDGRATAYVCERFACRQPVTEPQALAEQLAD
jgi:uncharacterized protein YyaL (SSP411 family)